MTDYERAVRMLNSTNTHMKLRERCRSALRMLNRLNNETLRPNFMRDVNLAIYRRGNAVRYQEQHFPGYDTNIDEGTRKEMEANHPLSGHGMAGLNTMIGLKKMADEAAAQLVTPYTGRDPSEGEIDQMVADYNAWRATLVTAPV